MFGDVTAGGTLEWHGDTILMQYKDASETAVNEVTKAAAARAAEITYEVFERRTGDAGESWQSVGATDQDGMITGEFGSYGVDYVIFLNDGTRFMTGGNMLLRAASETFPSLGGKIKVTGA